MNNDKDFLNDPIFRELRKFGSKSFGSENMPAELFTAFREAKVRKIRSKLFTRTLVGIGFAAIALPSLSYAHVLPKPIDDIVSRVGHLITAPIRVVASAVSSAPAPVDNLTNSPTPMPTGFINESPTPIPAPTSAIPSSPMVKPSEHGNSEHQENTDSSNGIEGPKGVLENHSDGEEGAIAPKIPSGIAGAPAIGGGSGTGKLQQIPKKQLQKAKSN